MDKNHIVREERFTQGVERIAESVERYVNERIESDKVIISLLKQISGDISDMNLREEIRNTFDKNQT